MKVRDAKTGRFVKNSPEVHATIDAVWRFIKPKNHIPDVRKMVLLYSGYVLLCLAAGALGGFLGARYGLN